MNGVSDADRARLLLRLALAGGWLAWDDIPAADLVVAYDLAAKVHIEGHRVNCRAGLRLTERGREAAAVLVEVIRQ